MYMYVNMILDTYFPHKTLQSIALWINHIRTCVGIGCELKKKGVLLTNSDNAGLNGLIHWRQQKLF